jgi:hypothetical protein
MTNGNGKGPKDVVDQLKAALEIMMAVADAIRDLGRVPSGHLYARLMGHMSLETYNVIIERLKGAGMIEEKNHELIWIGPKKKEGQ